MGRQGLGALCAIAMVVVVVCVDLLFFKHHSWERLGANVGIVLLFVSFNLRSLKHP